MIRRVFCLCLLFGLWDGVEVSVNDPVEVLGNSLRYLSKLIKVENPVCVGNTLRVSHRSDQLGKTDTGQVANSGLIRGGVFHDFTAQVGAANCSQILLVRL